MLKRLSNLIRSNVNDALDKAEDPRKILDQTILDMEGEHKKAKKALLEQLTLLKTAEKQADNLKKKSTEWEAKAMAALKAGSEDLAKQALGEKQKADALIEEAILGTEQQKGATEELKKSVKLLEQKINEAKGKRDELVARISAAEMKKKQAAMKSGEGTQDFVNDSSAFDTFDRMVDKIEQSEAEIEARRELSSDLDGNADEVNAELDKLSDASTADTALEALKAKMEADSGGGSSAPAPAQADDGGGDDTSSAIDDELAKLRAKLDGDG
jgi:phage shock protein A